MSSTFIAMQDISLTWANVFGLDLQSYIIILLHKELYVAKLYNWPDFRR